MSIADTEAKKLYDILHEDEADVDALIGMGRKYSPSQRLEIAAAYAKKFRDVQGDIKAKLSGSLLNAVLYMSYDPIERDARFLNEAMAGFGTDESCLHEILVVHSNVEIKSIKKRYEAVFKKELEKDVISETSFGYKKFLLSLLKASRKDGQDTEQAKNSAKALYDGGEGKLGTDDDAFIKTFTTESFLQLLSIFEEYDKMENASKMINAIKSEFSGELLNALVTTYSCIVRYTDFFAERIYRALSESDDKALIRYIITLEDGMFAINTQYQEIYGTTIYDDINKKINDNYGKLLIAVIKRSLGIKDDEKEPESEGNTSNKPEDSKVPRVPRELNNGEE